MLLFIIFFILFMCMLQEVIIYFFWKILTKIYDFIFIKNNCCKIFITIFRKLRKRVFFLILRGSNRMLNYLNNNAAIFGKICPLIAEWDTKNKKLYNYILLILCSIWYIIEKIIICVASQWNCRMAF